MTHRMGDLERGSAKFVDKRLVPTSYLTHSFHLQKQDIGTSLQDDRKESDYLSDSALGKQNADLDQHLVKAVGFSDMSKSKKKSEKNSADVIHMSEKFFIIRTVHVFLNIP